MTMADLSSLPSVWDRVRADDAFRAAMEFRRDAHFALRWKTPGWRMDHRLGMRRAIRSWKRYADTVKAAR